MGIQKHNPKNLLMAISFLAIVVVNNINREYVIYFVVPTSILIIYLLYMLDKYNKMTNKSPDNKLRLFYIIAIVINLFGGYLIAHSKGVI
ncbi:MAG: hypothetical protein WC622_13755 [Pedobacter sp.]|jgi:hypothetical protein|uniref:hypothetical protein n=1 Tax=Pedobacter sp. TaxID=1411316 RepID=UPI003566FA08